MTKGKLDLLGVGEVYVDTEIEAVARDLEISQQ
jgi:hypothetical protein